MQINPSPLEGGLRGVFHLNGDGPALYRHPGLSPAKAGVVPGSHGCI